jgi:hypothetical protein
MTSMRKYTLLAFCSTIILFFLPYVGNARDDYEREERSRSSRGDYDRGERSSSTRMSERDQSSFESFLDSHEETAQELYRDPELINNERFLRGHTALRNWLDEHQRAADAIRANPRAALWRERSVGERERSTGEREREERRPTAGETLRNLLK